MNTSGGHFLPPPNPAIGGLCDGSVATTVSQVTNCEVVGF